MWPTDARCACVPRDVEGSTAAYCLSLPGKTLNHSHLLSLKKFRRRGNKDGELRAFYMLEEEGLGKVLEVASLCVHRSMGMYCTCVLYVREHFLHRDSLIPSNTSLRKLGYQTPKMGELISQTNWANTTYL